MQNKPEYNETLVKLAQDLGADKLQSRVHNQVIYSQFDTCDDYGINGRRPSLDNNLGEDVDPQKN